MNGDIAKLSAKQRADATFELEILGMYACLFPLRQMASSINLLGPVVFNALDLYKKNWILKGMSETDAESNKIHFGKRFDRYDAAINECMTNPQKNHDMWMMCLASEAIQNCLHDRNIAKSLDRVSEMMLLVGYFIKTFRGDFSHGADQV